MSARLHILARQPRFRYNRARPVWSAYLARRDRSYG